MSYTCPTAGTINQGSLLAQHLVLTKEECQDRCNNNPNCDMIYLGDNKEDPTSKYKICMALDSKKPTGNIIPLSKLRSDESICVKGGVSVQAPAPAPAQTNKSNKTLWIILLSIGIPLIVILVLFLVRWMKKK
jgi:hypothetical protein